MMFDLPPRRTPPESIVPMINVLFLLLIFFLMTAQITPPDPLEVSPPIAALDDISEGDLTIYVDAGGTFAFDDLRGDAAVTAVLAQADRDSTLILKADASVPATVIAALLPRLAGGNFSDITLVTGAP